MFDDLVHGVPDQPSGGPGVGKVVLKVALTHPERSIFSTFVLRRKKPEDANPVPGVEVPSLLYPHCVHNWQVFIAVVGPWNVRTGQKWVVVNNVTCVNKVDNGLVFGKKEWGGGCCTEHWSAELRGHRLKKRCFVKERFKTKFDQAYIAWMLDSNATVRWEQILKPCGRTAWNAGGRCSCAASGSACSCRSWPRSPWTRPCLSRQAAVFHRSLKFQS